MNIQHGPRHAIIVLGIIRTVVVDIMEQLPGKLVGFRPRPLRKVFPNIVLFLQPPHSGKRDGYPHPADEETETRETAVPVPEAEACPRGVKPAYLASASVVCATGRWRFLSSLHAHFL